MDYNDGHSYKINSSGLNTDYICATEKYLFVPNHPKNKIFGLNMDGHIIHIFDLDMNWNRCICDIELCKKHNKTLCDNECIIKKWDMLIKGNKLIIICKRKCMPYEFSLKMRQFSIMFDIIM